MRTEARPEMDTLPRDDRSRGVALLVVAASVLLFVGCRQDMHDQAKYEPLEASAFFADGTSARPIPAHTVARGALERGDAFATGILADGSWVEELPLELDAELLARGEERYEIFCTPCHDPVGSGRGMIVLRGFKQPPSYHQDRLRDMPLGYFFDVITNGYGLMSPYKAQVKPEDRWAIAAWIRVLQLSQAAPVETLAASDRSQLEQLDNTGHSASGGEEH